jgi:hypothetical protein
MDCPHLIQITARWVSFLACIALAVAQAPTDPVSQICAAREQSNRALAMHDVKGFGESLAADFVIVRGNGVFMPSRQAWMDAIEAYFKNQNAVRHERARTRSDFFGIADRRRARSLDCHVAKWESGVYRHFNVRGLPQISLTPQRHQQ